MGYKRFEFTDLVDENIEKDFFNGVRHNLTDMCRLDRTFTTGAFDDGLEYVQKIKGVNLYQPFKASMNPLYAERIERKDPSLKDEDFVDSVFYLEKNFCLERIEDTRKLGRYLFPQEMHKEKSKVQQEKKNSRTQKMKMENPIKGGSKERLWMLAAGILVLMGIIVYLTVK